MVLFHVSLYILFSYFSYFFPDFVILFFEIAVAESVSALFLAFRVAALYVIAFQHFVNWTGTSK